MHRTSDEEDLLLPHSVWELGWEDLNSCRWPDQLSESWNHLDASSHRSDSWPGTIWRPDSSGTVNWGTYLHGLSRNGGDPHNSLKVLGLLTRQLWVARACVPASKAEVTSAGMTYPWSCFCQTLLASTVTGLLRVKGGGHRHSSWWKQCQRTCGHIFRMLKIVLITFILQIGKLRHGDAK